MNYINNPRNPINPINQIQGKATHTNGIKIIKAAGNRV
jgi:hypothetical protein